jgi:hypothetical protein
MPRTPPRSSVPAPRPPDVSSEERRQRVLYYSVITVGWTVNRADQPLPPLLQDRSTAHWITVRSRAALVLNSFGSGMMPTRGRSSRSASQQVPMVASALVFPSVCPSHAWQSSDACSIDPGSRFSPPEASRFPLIDSPVNLSIMPVCNKEADGHFAAGEGVDRDGGR